MRRQEILELYDSELRLAAPLPGEGFRHEHAGSILRLVGPSAAAHDNCILFSRLDTALADAAIDEEIARFRALGHAFEWKLHGHDGPHDMAERLVRHGLTPEVPETILVRDLVEKPPDSSPLPAIDIRRVDDIAGLSSLVAVQDEVWNEDHAWFGDTLAAELAVAPDQVEILVGYADGQPVATSLLRLHRGTHFGSLWAAATLPAFQRRGIYSGLVERHATTAQAARIPLLIVDANANSRPPLERVGFRPLVDVQGYVWRPEG